MTVTDWVLCVAAGLVALPGAILLGECLASLLPLPRWRDPEGLAPRLAVLVPAHNEQGGVGATVRGFTDVVTATVAKGEPVAITGFAKFAKIERPARMGRNPATGEAIKIKASKKVAFRAAKELKEAV